MASGIVCNSSSEDLEAARVTDAMLMAVSAFVCDVSTAAGVCSSCGAGVREARPESFPAPAVGSLVFGIICVVVVDCRGRLVDAPATNVSIKWLAFIGRAAVAA